MARRVPPTSMARNPETTLAMVDAGGPVPVVPTLPGGGMGIVGPGSMGPEQASTKIHFGLPEAAAITEPDDHPIRPKRYRVRNAPQVPGKPDGFPIVVDGAIAYLRNGKLIDETTYDIRALLRQGVDLESLDPPDPEPAIEDEASED